MSRNTEITRPQCPWLTAIRKLHVVELKGAVLVHCTAGVMQRDGNSSDGGDLDEDEST